MCSACGFSVLSSRRSLASISFVCCTYNQHVPVGTVQFPNLAHSADPRQLAFCRPGIQIYALDNVLQCVVVMFSMPLLSAFDLPPFPPPVPPFHSVVLSTLSKHRRFLWIPHYTIWPLLPLTPSDPWKTNRRTRGQERDSVLG